MSPFGRAPFIVIWETTRACALACVHCRAEAIPHRHPKELTTEEGKRLIDRVRAFGDPPPILVLTGGDPLRRPDLVELIAHGAFRGLSVSLTPSGTAAVTEPRLRALRDAGLARLAVSLDGATAVVHDAFRRVRGSHRNTLRIVERARALGLPLQINSTVCRHTVADLPALARQMEEFGVILWALFFLIPVGRAQAEQALSAVEIERVLEWAADITVSAPFGVKTTEAPHYHRVLARRAPAISDVDAPIGASSWLANHQIGELKAGSRRHPGPATRSGSTPPLEKGIGRAGRAVTDGNGFVFIDHLGAICPSGFLPMRAGNVREDDLIAVYREDPLFVSLRDPSRLGGRCGQCEYRGRCGGSRARAYALTGDPLAEDPGCWWQPRRLAEAHVIAGGSGPAPVSAAERAAPAGLPPTGPPSQAPSEQAITLAAAPDLSAGAAEPARDQARTVGGVAPAQVVEALSGVLDPELGLSVVELGLIYRVEVSGARVAITMTLTAPGCPIHDVMPEWIREAVLRVPGIETVDVTLTFDPPWTPDRIGRSTPELQSG
jgi:radical SAM protein